MFGTQVRFINNALLQVILAPGLVKVSISLTDTARADVFVAVLVMIVDAFGAIGHTDYVVAGPAPRVVICTDCLFTTDTVCTI